MNDLATSLLLICAATTFAAGLVVAQRRLVANVARRFTGLSRFEQALLVVAVGVMTVCAQKSGTNGVFNAEEEEARRRGEEDLTAQRGSGLLTASQEEGSALVQRGSGLLTASTEEDDVLSRSDETSLPLSISDSATSASSVLRAKNLLTTNDIARGFAFVEARTNATVSYEMPTNGTVVGTWGKTGAYEDVVRVKLATEAFSNGSVLRAKKTDRSFSFPLGNSCITSLWVYTWGKVRPRLRDKAREIVAVGAPMSVVPGEGRLWTAPTTNGSWLITWENFRAGREILNAEIEESQKHGEEESTNASVLCVKNSNPVSVQIELFPNGDFITRSNDVERVYRRVNPDDWDGDGIANEIDGDPLVAADTLQFGPNQDFSVIEHEENYYWIDIVVPQANAKVTFAGNGESNLADPSFIAKAGETNRVTLLIGKPYVATCAFPFEIVDKSSALIDVRCPNDRCAEVCWPVAVSLADGSGALFGMTVQPSSLVGTFFWTNYCCGVSGKSNSFSYLCARNNCRCTGCSALGFFRYEGFFVNCVGGACGCLPSGGPPQESDPASVSVSFSKNAIIFEDAYDNTPTEHVSWRSTETVLSCTASGGGRGGFLYVSLEDGGRLVRYGGQSLPYSKSLAANETISFTCRYRATKASDVEGDIKVMATFTENETGTKQSADDEATAVRVRITPEIEAPENDCVGRHMYGIREEVRCRYFPSSAPVSWRVKSGCRMDGEILTCSLDAMENPLSILCGDDVYTPNVSIVEPSGVECRDVVAETYGVPVNHAGGVGMRFELYVLPLTVSFEGIAVEEVPCSEGTHTGYFAYSRFSGVWSHTEANGAGNWIDIQTGNLFGVDRPAITGELSRITDDGLLVDDDSYGWKDGELVWPIPLGWNDKGTTRGMKEYKRFNTDVTHVTEIFENGRSGVRKLGNQVYRDIDGTVNLNGRIVHED